MKPLALLATIATLLTATLLTATGQIPTATLAPFLLTIHQQIPTTVTLTLADNLTTTLPLTLTVNLQIAVTGPHSVTVTTTPTTPTLTLAPLQPATTLTDTLGYPYQITALDDTLALIEWTTYQDSNNTLTLAGELRNTSPNQRFSSAEIVIRLYRPDNTLLAIETTAAGNRWVDPNQTIRFSTITYADPTQLHHYTIEITGQDWTAIP